MSGKAMPIRERPGALAHARLLVLVSRLCHESRYSRDTFVLVDAKDLAALSNTHFAYIAAIAKRPEPEEDGE